MRHYEIVFMVHPDCGDQVSGIINYYTEMVTGSGGTVYRMENWGRRQLAYSIKKLNKAFYILLNVETSKDVLDKLSNDFKFNEIILRNIIIRMRCAITDPSPMLNKQADGSDYGGTNVVHQKCSST